MRDGGTEADSAARGVRVRPRGDHADPDRDGERQPVGGEQEASDVAAQGLRDGPRQHPQDPLAGGPEGVREA